VKKNQPKISRTLPCTIASPPPGLAISSPHFWQNTTVAIFVKITCSLWHFLHIMRANLLVGIFTRFVVFLIFRTYTFTNSNFFERHPLPRICFLPHSLHLNRRSIFLAGFSPDGFSFGKLPYPRILRLNLRWPCVKVPLTFFFTVSTECSVCLLQVGQCMRIFFGYFIFNHSIILF